MDDFKQHIYNDDYLVVDPDYETRRPDANADMVKRMFSGKTAHIRHLDYGGGNGRLSGMLKKDGWNSSTWDPFAHSYESLQTMGHFNLITVFEVFEHVSDIDQLMRNLSLLAADDGLILFSTLVSDGNIQKNKRLTWWYASPRSGHIILFSRKSLHLLAEKYGFHFKSFNNAFHVLFSKELPDWASHLTLS